jgi:hypothetical protein
MNSLIIEYLLFSAKWNINSLRDGSRKMSSGGGGIRDVLSCIEESRKVLINRPR